MSIRHQLGTFPLSRASDRPLRYLTVAMVAVQWRARIWEWACCGLAQFHVTVAVVSVRVLCLQTLSFSIILFPQSTDFDNFVGFCPIFMFFACFNIYFSEGIHFWGPFPSSARLTFLSLNHTNCGDYVQRKTLVLLIFSL